MIELVIFDWDDVITLGSTDGYKKCYHEALLGVGIRLSPEEELKRIQAKWGSPHREELAELLKEQPHLLDEAVQIYETKLFGETFVDCLSIVPGSVELLSSLAKDYKLALATGLHPKLLRERIMPKFNINESWFSQIITAYDLDDANHAKPHPYSGLKILEVQDVSSEHAIMVGDSQNDVLMARAADIEPVVVLTGHLNLKQAKDLDVTHIIDDVSKLSSILDIL